MLKPFFFFYHANTFKSCTLKNVKPIFNVPFCFPVPYIQEIIAHISSTCGFHGTAVVTPEHHYMFAAVCQLDPSF